MNGGAMTPTFLFHKTYSDMRVIGRRGGLAHARNLRARRADQPPTPVRVVNVPREETSAEAIVLLDRQFPHLRGAEPRTPRRAAV
jgi:hypothetical protein